MERRYYAGIESYVLEGTARWLITHRDRHVFEQAQADFWVHEMCTELALRDQDDARGTHLLALPRWCCDHPDDEVECPDCGGTGWWDTTEGLVRCDLCAGTRAITLRRYGEVTQFDYAMGDDRRREAAR